jgi:hypothetical protein
VERVGRKEKEDSLVWGWWRSVGRRGGKGKGRETGTCEGCWMVGRHIGWIAGICIGMPWL